MIISSIVAGGCVIVSPLVAKITYVTTKVAIEVIKEVSKKDKKKK